MSGRDDGGKADLPLFDLGKGRAPRAERGIRPLPRRAPPEADRAPPPPEPARRPDPPPKPPPPAREGPPAPPPAAGAPGAPLPGVPVADRDLAFRPTPMHPQRLPGAPRPTPMHTPPSTGAPRPTPMRGVPSPGGHEPASPAYPFDPRARAAQDFVHPASSEVSSFLQVFLRAMRGRRLYPDGNPVLEGYLEQAHVNLSTLLSRHGSIVLLVREDRLFFGEDAVHVDPDRQDGLPFLLFSHSIEQVELSRGMPREELEALVRELAKDFSSDEHVGEDLVTALWRAHLPHFDYTVIDVYNLVAVDRGRFDPSAMLVDDETRRLREELEHIVGALREQSMPQPPADGGALARIDPIAAQIDVADETPEANQWDMQAILRDAGLVGVDVELRARLREVDDREALLTRLTDLLLSALRAEEGVEDTPGWYLLLALIDAILRGRQFAEARRLCDRLAHSLAARSRPEDLALATRVLRYLGSDACVQVVLQVLDTTAEPGLTQEALSLLEHLGPHAYGAMVRGLSSLQQPRARRLVVERVGALGGQDRGELLTALRGASAGALRDVLGLGETLPAHVASDLVWLGAEHPDEGVRARAVALLRGFGGREADQLVARFMEDRAATVRTAAFRAASHRKSQVVLDAFLRLLESKEVDRIEPTEAQVLLSALVGVGKDKVTPVLAHILNDSVGLGISRRSPELRAAAAHALGMVGSPAAQAALQAGSRTLNRKVKTACKLALESKSTGALHLELPARFGELGARPPEIDAPPPAPAPPAPSEARVIVGLPASPPAGPRIAPPSVPLELSSAPDPDGLRLVSREQVRLPSSEARGADADGPPPGPPRATTAEEAAPPLLDPHDLRLASGVTDPAAAAAEDPTEPPDAPGPLPPTRPERSAGAADAASVLEAPTLREPSDDEAASTAPTAPAPPAAPPPGLADDLSLDDAPPARVAPPRLPTDALVEVADEGRGDGEEGP